MLRYSAVLGGKRSRRRGRPSCKCWKNNKNSVVVHVGMFSGAIITRDPMEMRAKRDLQGSLEFLEMMYVFYENNIVKM